MVTAMSDGIGNVGEGGADGRQETGYGNMLSKADCGHGTARLSNVHWFVDLQYGRFLQFG